MTIQYIRAAILVSRWPSSYQNSHILLFLEQKTASSASRANSSLLPGTEKCTTFGLLYVLYGRLYVRVQVSNCIQIHSAFVQIMRYNLKSNTISCGNSIPLLQLIVFDFKLNAGQQLFVHPSAWVHVILW